MIDHLKKQIIDGRFKHKSLDKLSDYQVDSRDAYKIQEEINNQNKKMIDALMQASKATKEYSVGLSGDKERADKLEAYQAKRYGEQQKELVARGEEKVATGLEIASRTEHYQRGTPRISLRRIGVWYPRICAIPNRRSMGASFRRLQRSSSPVGDPSWSRRDPGIPRLGEVTTHGACSQGPTLFVRIRSRHGLATHLESLRRYDPEAYRALATTGRGYRRPSPRP